MAEIAEVVDRIVREHATTPALAAPALRDSEVTALFGRIATASLFDGALVLALDPMEDVESVHDVYRIGRLRDGRSLCAETDAGGATRYFVAPLVRKAQYPSNAIGVVRYIVDEARREELAGALAEILNRALASNGMI